MEVRKHMRKRITMLIMAAMLALTLSLGGQGRRSRKNVAAKTSNLTRPALRAAGRYRF
jgi:hypothetical protein